MLLKNKSLNKRSDKGMKSHRTWTQRIFWIKSRCRTRHQSQDQAKQARKEEATTAAIRRRQSSEYHGGSGLIGAKSMALTALNYIRGCSASSP
jgi:hypothetical protein